jgi:hypothetical protein
MRCKQHTTYRQVLDSVGRYDWLDNIFFYELVDDPGSAAEYGMLHSELTPKLAYDACQCHIRRCLPS